ncbi:hypothetical protein ACLOJK_011825 [Asimina triloba]
MITRKKIDELLWKTGAHAGIITEAIQRANLITIQMVEKKSCVRFPLFYAFSYEDYVTSFSFYPRFTRVEFGAEDGKEKNGVGWRRQVLGGGGANAKGALQPRRFPEWAHTPLSAIYDSAARCAPLRALLLLSLSGGSHHSAATVHKAILSCRAHALTIVSFFASVPFVFEKHEYQYANAIAGAEEDKSDLHPPTLSGAL